METKIENNRYSIGESYRNSSFETSSKEFDINISNVKLLVSNKSTSIELMNGNKTSFKELFITDPNNGKYMNASSILKSIKYYYDILGITLN